MKYFQQNHWTCEIVHVSISGITFQSFLFDSVGDGSKEFTNCANLNMAST